MDKQELIQGFSDIAKEKNIDGFYPTKFSEINLNVITAYKNKFPNFVIGYSGHEYDLEPTVLAVALGAKIIERHITLDHNMWGTDQKSSLEVHAMDLLGKRVKNVGETLGKPEKIITEYGADSARWFMLSLIHI